MNTPLRSALFAALLPLLACSGSDAEGGAAGGASGSSGSPGGAAGSTASGGASAGNGGSLAGFAGSTGGSSAGLAGANAAGAETGGTGGTGGSAGTASGGASGSGQGGTAGAPSTAFQLLSPAFAHVEACTTANRTPCNFFPAPNTYTNIGGQNQSPELSWSAGPSGTMSYVVCLHDTSVGATGATHWCLWNIPASVRMLPANLARQKMPAVPAGSSQDNLFNVDEGYVGPGARGNVYQFRLYALNVASFTPSNPEDRRTVYNALEANMGGVVLASSTLRGRANPQQ